MSEKYGRTISDQEVSQLKDAEVLLADNNAFQQFAEKLPSLKWFQGTWAGLEGLAAYFKDKPAPPYLMSRMSSTIFCQLMAEYVVGQIIVHERGWRDADKYQSNGQWHHSGKIAEHRSLAELSVGVLGTGQIGQQIGRALKTFGCTVAGLSRSSHDPASLQQAFDELYTGNEGLIKMIKKSDYIVSCLPSTPQTTGMLNASVLSQFKKDSVLISIGRSNVMSEEDLLNALDVGPLDAAVLDVFDTEPLPATSKLWTHPKIVMTPHCAGVSRAQDVAATFVENYKRYTSSQTLNFQVDITTGY